MHPAGHDRSSSAERWLRAGWVALPVAAALFTGLRLTLSLRAVSQALFLAPIAAAMLLLWRAGGSCPRGSRARRRWRLFAAAACSAFLGEAALSSVALGLAAERPAHAVFEVAAATGAGFLVAAAVMTAGGGITGRRRARRVLDGVAIETVVFALVYRAVGERYYAREADLVGALATTVTILVGILLLQLGALILADMRARRAPFHPPLAAAVVLLGIATVLWTLGEMVAPQPNGHDVATVSAVMSFVAYYLLMMGALQRVLLPAGALGPRARPARSPVSGSVPQLLAGLLLAGLASGSIAWLIWLAFVAPSDSAARTVYTAALAVGALALVGRTWLSSSEVARLDESSLVDAVTGAYGARALGTAWEAVRGSAAHQGLLAAVSFLDLDALVRTNAAAGFGAGDRHLRAVADALERAAGPHSWVVRVGGDEFAVLSVVPSAPAARMFGERLAAAVPDLSGAPALTASVGVATADAEETDARAVLRRAKVACAWAKRCGGARAVAWEPRLARLVSLDDRLTTSAYVDEGVARALLHALAVRDPTASDHSANVAALSRLLAEEIGCSEEHVERIELAALLHDVGTIAAPGVGEGSGPHGADGARAVREHCELGQRLVEALGDATLGAWVRGHHERWDGTGEPDGLAGSSIPLEARIIALADVYDRLTASRRQGAPLSRAAALQEIDTCLGTRFDPELGERFIVLVGTMPGLGPSRGRGVA